MQRKQFYCMVNIYHFSWLNYFFAFQEEACISKSGKVHRPENILFSKWIEANIMLRAVQVRGKSSRQLPDVAPRHGGQDGAALPVLAAVSGPGGGGSSI